MIILISQVVSDLARSVWSAPYISTACTWIDMLTYFPSTRSCIVQYLCYSQRISSCSQNNRPILRIERLIESKDNEFWIFLSNYKGKTISSKSVFQFYQNHSLTTVCCSLKQPQQKIRRCFSLPACKVTIGGSKSVEKSILQQRP